MQSISQVGGSEILCSSWLDHPISPHMGVFNYRWLTSFTFLRSLRAEFLLKAIQLPSQVLFLIMTEGLPQKPQFEMTHTQHTYNYAKTECCPEPIIVVTKQTQRELGCLTRPLLRAAFVLSAWPLCSRLVWLNTGIKVGVLASLAQGSG